MQRQAGPSSVELTTIAEVKSFSQSNTAIRAVAFFKPSVSGQTLERYKESGNDLRMDMELGHTTDEGLAKEMGFKTDTIVVFHPR